MGHLYEAQTDQRPAHIPHQGISLVENTIHPSDDLKWQGNQGLWHGQKEYEDGSADCRATSGGMEEESDAVGFEEVVQRDENGGTST